MHPTLGDLKELTDSQIEQKLYKLNSIYFLTDNSDVRQQMILVMDAYKLELEERRIAAKLKQPDDNNDLDNLIKIS